MTNYPDIDNSILLFPDRWNYSTQTLATINWMDFSMLGGLISKDNLINVENPQIATSAIPPQVWVRVTWTQRMTSIDALTWLVWQTIWKTIIIPDLISTGQTTEMKWRVWIFHSDWTITFFNQEQELYNVASSTFASFWTSESRWRRMDSSLQQWVCKRIPITKILKTDWIVVQEWDRPYAEIYYWSTGYVSFWSYNAVMPTLKIQPFQFSID